MGEVRPPETGPAPPPARFVTGSTFRHVVVMGATGSVGLMAIFVVDLLSLLYIARLGDPVLTAAVGFATIVQIFAVSINIGMMIAVGALVSRALGGGDVERARRLAASSLVLAVAASGLVTVLMLPLLTPFLTLIGAGPETVPAARTFLWIALPSTLMMALGMGFSGVLRAVGDARRGMNVTLAGAAVTVVLDPLLIFGLHLGIEGAAVTIVIARLAFAWVGYSGAVRVHRMVAKPTLAAVMADAGPILRVALPTVLTNLAPPWRAPSSPTSWRDSAPQRSPATRWSTGWCRWPSAASLRSRAPSARSSVRTGAPAASTGCARACATPPW